MSEPRPFLRIALFLGLAVLLAQFHHAAVTQGRHADRVERHTLILAGHGEAPWVHRPLAPLLAEGGSRVLEAVGVPRVQALETAYAAWRGAFIFGFLLLFHRWLRHWVGEGEAMAGTLLVAALHGPSFAWYWYQPDSPLDLVLWAAAAVVTVERRDGWLLPILAVGGMNRETSIFLVALHLALRWGEEPLGPLLRRCLLLSLLWAAPVVAVHLNTGPVGWAHGQDPLGFLRANLAGSWLAYAASFFGVAWLAPVLGWRRCPPALRRLALVLVPYLVLQFLFGRVREVRLFLPMAVVLVPMLLLWWRPAAEAPAVPRARAS